VQRPTRAAGWVGAPQALGQLLDRHGVVRAEQQRGEEDALFARRHGNAPRIDGDLERTEYAEI
jgi:hypothetical protein